jgi:hypothetical protein
VNKLLLCVGAALVFGCAGAQHPTVQALECRYTLLKPYLGDATEEVVNGGLRDPQSVAMALLNLGLDPLEVQRLGDAWHACTGETPRTEPTPVRAPPPARGLKVM